MPLHVNRFIVTSNFTPSELYPDDPRLPALLRRIDEHIEFTKEGLSDILQSISRNLIVAMFGLIAVADTQPSIKLISLLNRSVPSPTP